MQRNLKLAPLIWKTQKAEAFYQLRFLRPGHIGNLDFPGSSMLWSNANKRPIFCLFQAAQGIMKECSRDKFIFCGCRSTVKIINHVTPVQTMMHWCEKKTSIVLSFHANSVTIHCSYRHVQTSFKSNTCQQIESSCLWIFQLSQSLAQSQANKTSLHHLANFQGSWC